ncbi:prepilin-type N-terminal cleavage/methylation domain-containing protein [Dendrosporobacter sp. 1207_IL3150]|uniref:prepilin-type N-terminal cleavage/methylation domain-containing protein n=1 Tax=Dendrosporobacter sp. 1207_IL3150 TaxID=3084054 RepID=UPI002FDAA905
MFKILTNKKGFTLVELIVGMAIMVIILTGVLGIMRSSIQSYDFSKKRVYEAQQSRVAINAIIDDLRNATAITEPTKGNTQDSITYTLNAANHTIELGSGQDEGRLMRDATAMTSNIVTNISFARDAADGRIIAVRATLNSPDNRSSDEFVIETVVFASNLTQ